jgi:hypothetical protein
MDQIATALPTILTALVLASVLWVIRTTNETQRDVAVLKANATTDRLELERVRSRYHEMATMVQRMAGAEELATQFVVALDRRDLERDARDRELRNHATRER